MGCAGAGTKELSRDKGTTQRQNDALKARTDYNRRVLTLLLCPKVLQRVGGGRRGTTPLLDWKQQLGSREHGSDDGRALQGMNRTRGLHVRASTPNEVVETT